jgi:type 1 glutamine amidotransferase
MNKIFQKLTFTLFILCLVHTYASAKKQSVLVFAKTSGFHHESIAVGLPALIKLGAENNFSVDTTTDATKFTAENLKKYDAVIFLSTTGDVLNDEQQTVFQKYIEAGHGFVGIHAATDTEYDWPWYGKLVGAWFINHPAQQVATLNIVNPNTIATRHLPAVWKRKDEWYSFKNIAPDLNVLITIDEKSYEGGKNGDNHPMAWYHDYDGGRSFYTELGHVDESYTDPLFLKHILGGIQYAIGTKKMILRK